MVAENVYALKALFLYCVNLVIINFSLMQKKKKMRIKDEHLDTVDRPSVSAYELQITGISKCDRYLFQNTQN